VLILLTQFAFHALKIKDALQDLLGSASMAIRNKVSYQQLFGYIYADEARFLKNLKAII
jgi:hypothetical protein